LKPNTAPSVLIWGVSCRARYEIIEAEDVLALEKLIDHIQREILSR